MSNPVVWQPDVQQVQTCQLSRFMQFVSQIRQETLKQPPTFNNYTDLHHWSVSEPHAFWRAVWDFCRLTSVEPASVVLGNNTMPGAQWFPGMTLNFARNLLRLAEGEQANNEAVVAYCETRPVLRCTCWPQPAWVRFSVRPHRISVWAPFWIGSRKLSRPCW